ncbi:MAG: response regulator [Polyangia bacterium]|jgi:CheY-like chemotaxis protein
MKTILLVDDEFALTEILTSILEEEGYRVVTAANGKDGMVRLEKEQPALVLVDYMMPIMNGREFILEARRIPQYQGLPLVMMSSVSPRIALADGEGGQLEVAGFLTKPFQLAALLGTIERLIGQP